MYAIWIGNPAFKELFYSEDSHTNNPTDLYNHTNSPTDLYNHTNNPTDLYTHT